MSKSNLVMNTKSVYRQNQFPVLQNRVYCSAEEARNYVLGDIDIVQDLDSGLIFNAAFKSDLMVYDANYNNEQGFSGVFQKHLNWVAHTIEAHFDKQNLFEVSCGKGFFLELLLTLGFEITGFDFTCDGTNE